MLIGFLTEAYLIVTQADIYKAFDGDSNSTAQFTNNTSTWITMDFGNPVIVKYILWEISNATSGDLDLIYFHGSNDNLNWTQLAAQFYHIGYFMGTPHGWAIFNSSSYRYYRILFPYHYSLPDNGYFKNISFYDRFL